MAKQSPSIENAAADMQKNFQEQTAQMAARMEDVADFAQGNVDAFIASATKATESMKEITTEILGYTKAVMDNNVAVIKEMAELKDPAKAMEKQTAFAKESMEGFAKQAQKLNEMSMAAAKECVEPVNARFAAVGEMVKSGGFMK
ncbi:MAG: phasin family protein [Neomegalonema sp.]|nr:phasin family protein [Neomegalonema sp.]